MTGYFMKLSVMLLGITVFASSGPAQEGVPEWVDNVTFSEGIYRFQGSGEGKQEALLFALVELAGAIDTHIFSSTSIAKDGTLIGENTVCRSTLSLGKVNIQSKTIQEAKKVTDDAEKSQISESKETIFKVDYSDGEKLMLMNLTCNKTMVEGHDEKTENYEFQVIAKNCTISDLFDELKALGFRFRFYGDDQRYCIQIEVDEKSIEKVSNQGR